MKFHFLFRFKHFSIFCIYVGLDCYLLVLCFAVLENVSKLIIRRWYTFYTPQPLLMMLTWPTQAFSPLICHLSDLYSSEWGGCLLSGVPSASVVLHPRLECCDNAHKGSRGCVQACIPLFCSPLLASLWPAPIQ